MNIDWTYLPLVVSQTGGKLTRSLAMQAAIHERGVGMVILPGDIAAAEIEHPMVKHPSLADRPLIRPDDETLDKAVELVSKAKKIAIHGGEGTQDARDQVLEPAGKLKAPVSYAYRGKDVLEADNPNGMVPESSSLDSTYHRPGPWRAIQVSAVHLVDEVGAVAG